MSRLPGPADGPRGGAASAIRTVGVDPGKGSGGAAVVSGGRVLAWWAYVEVASGVRARGRGVDGVAREWRAATLSGLAVQIGPLVREAGPSTLVLEGLFQGRGKAGLLRLAESAGVWLGALEPLTAGPALRPTATAWRRDVLGLAGDVSADRAEEYAVRWAARHLAWPGGGAGPGAGLTRAEEGAVSEAATIACWTPG